MWVCMYVCMYVRTYVRMYVCMYVCMYMYMYLFTCVNFKAFEGLIVRPGMPKVRDLRQLLKPQPWRAESAESVWC